MAQSYPAYAELLEALDPYARLMGWRYVHNDFMQLDDPKASAELQSAREHGVAAVLDYGERLRRISAAPANERAQSTLVQEFELSQRKVHPPLDCACSVALLTLPIPSPVGSAGSGVQDDGGDVQGTWSLGKLTRASRCHRR